MTVYRLCEDCCRHEAMRDARKCPECMNAYLRSTRMGRLPAWRRRVVDPVGEGATRGTLARDETGRAAA